MRNLVGNLLRGWNHQRIVCLLFGLILDLSIYLSNPILNFKIGSTHIYSSTIDFSNLNLSNQLLSNLLINIPYKAKAPT